MYEGSARNPVIGKEVSQRARSGPSESDAVTSGHVMLKPLPYQVLLRRISVPRIRTYDKTCVDHKLLCLHILCDHFAAGDSVALTGPRTCLLRDLLSEDRISCRSFIHSRWRSSFNAGVSHSWICVVHPFEGSCKEPHILREIWRGMYRAIEFIVEYRGVRHSRR